MVAEKTQDVVNEKPIKVLAKRADPATIGGKAPGRKLEPKEAADRIFSKHKELYKRLAK